MARAGFYAVESGKISFRHDGHWYNDEERIENPRIALLFSRSLKRNPDGSYVLQVADERAPITIEDTPYVVTGVEDDGRGGWVIVTNDQVRETLDPSTLEVGDAHVLYCRVKQGEFRARFLRHAYYHLAEHFVTDDGENFSLMVGGRRYPIRIASAAAANAASAPDTASANPPADANAASASPSTTTANSTATKSTAANASTASSSAAGANPSTAAKPRSRDLN